MQYLWHKKSICCLLEIQISLSSLYCFWQFSTLLSQALHSGTFYAQSYRWRHCLPGCIPRLKRSDACQDFPGASGWAHVWVLRWTEALPLSHGGCVLHYSGRWSCSGPTLFSSFLGVGRAHSWRSIIFMYLFLSVIINNYSYTNN